MPFSRLQLDLSMRSTTSAGLKNADSLPRALLESFFCGILSMGFPLLAIGIVIVIVILN